MINLESYRSFRTIRLAIAAMAMGVLAFGAMVIFMINGDAVTPEPAHANVLLLVLAGLAAVEVVAYALARGVILNRVRKDWDGAVADEKSIEGVLGGFATLMLTGAAMAEGLGLLGVVTLLLTGAWTALAAPGLALCAIALAFPTQAKFSEFARKVTGRHWG